MIDYKKPSFLNFWGFLVVLLFFCSALKAQQNQRFIPIGLFHFEEFHYLNLEKRLGLIEEAHRFVKNSYSGWRLKGCVDCVFEDAKVEERLFHPDIKNNSDDYFFGSENYYQHVPKLAHANLKFFDRFRSLLAKFNDSHLIFETTVPMPYITCDLRLEKVGSSLVFSSHDKQLNIEKGDVLLEIDGKSPQEYLSMMMAHIPASSELARERLAVEALTFRNFLYPLSAENRIKFRKAQSEEVLEATVPWKLGTRNSRDDIYFHLKSIGYEEEKLFESRHRQVVVEGQRLYDYTYDFYSQAYSLELRNFTEYQAPTEQRELLMRVGTWTHQQQEFGVLQIFSFSSTYNDHGESLLVLIREALKNFRDKGVPVIVDMRNNWGGISSLAMNVARLFLKQGEMLSPPGISFLRNSYVINLMNNLDILSPNKKGSRLRIYGVGIAEFWNRIISLVGDPRKGALNREAIGDVDRSQLNYFPVVNGAYLKDRLNGQDPYFDGRIAVLTGPLCRSICEVFVRLLAQDRVVREGVGEEAVLVRRKSPVITIGEATQGTGLGYIENSRADRLFQTSWTDTRSFIRLRVPNFLSTVSPEKEKSILYQKTDEMCTENRPFVPQIPYQMTVDDVRFNDRDALNFAAEKILEAEHGYQHAVPAAE